MVPVKMLLLMLFASWAESKYFVYESKGSFYALVSMGLGLGPVHNAGEAAVSDLQKNECYGFGSTGQVSERR
ncbi:hypothetical protein OH686_13120 [Pseudomonas sp. SO81]|nr:hypothetical protein OH686_13120 [Pseudomonas sp. SO81]